MPNTVAQHAIATFSSPTNGSSPIDANTVRGNDNTIRTSYNSHDADPGVHVQSSTLASRPIAGTAGRKWITADSGSYRLWYDDGTSWQEMSYASSAGGTIAGNLLVTGTLGVNGLLTATGGVSGNLTGNADTATALATARNINGVSFNGTADITVTAAAGTLSGSTLAAGVTASSLTSVGTLSSLTVTNPITGSVTGNAGTATALQTTRTLWGQNFNGSANVSGNLSSVGNITGTGAVTVAATSANLGLSATGANAIQFYTNSVLRAQFLAAGDLQVDSGAKIYGPTGSNVLNLRDSSGTADAREWSFRIVSGALEFRSVSDANATQTTVVSFARAGGVTIPTGGIAVTGNSTITGTATVTGDLTVDTSTFKVDAANNRVGVNTATPATTLDVNGATTLRGNVSFLADAAHDIGAVASARPRTVYAATSVIAPVMTENGLAVVSQADVGTSANDLPLNQTLGTMAFQDAASITVGQVQRAYVVRATNTAAQDLRNTFASQVGIDADTTLTSAVPLAGTEGTVVIVTVGTTSRTVTFGTGFASTGTLATGTAADRRFVVRFISDGTRLLEVSRTTAITV
jgi:hypothetical protein